MTKVAAESADGMIMHPFSSERYMREVTLPAIHEGLAKRGLALADFELDYAPMIATGTTEEALQEGIAVLRDRIAFYGCTVAYKPVLDIHGWGDLQEELIQLNRQHKTAEMAALITDDMVNTIGIVGEPQEVISTMQQRFQGVISRTGFSIPGMEDAEMASLLSQLKG